MRRAGPNWQRLGLLVAGAGLLAVAGTPAAGPGVTGKLGTIKRSDGTTQAVYNGHPLYTYIADTAPARPTATTST